ncbi:SUZ domain-containing protein 1-like [Oppia nitens]|uniref:SUZ domain-containing protein 1-like n=1 Tax=Oppia nitens TaxID=1686743 RepID=UPI0023DBC1DA|nr:SUZ domain-containing protein 1-like [Oppia nitens]
MAMSEEVLDSWEDMIDDNGLLDNKFSDMNINNSKTSVKSATSDGNSSFDVTQESQQWPQLTNNSTNDNSIRILKRPTNIVSNMSSANTSSSDTNQNQTIITLEDNTRTQYVPPVRILKRPDTRFCDPNNKSLNKLTNGNKSTNSKTYEEREADYAKARLRILGSASAPEEDTNLTQNSSLAAIAMNNRLSPESSSTKLDLNKHLNETTNNVPIIRLPLGPDGTKGFNSQIRAQQQQHR